MEYQDLPDGDDAIPHTDLSHELPADVVVYRILRTATTVSAVTFRTRLLDLEPARLPRR